MKMTKIERLSHSCLSLTKKMHKAFDNDRHDKFIYFKNRRTIREQQLIAEGDKLFL